jgi:hypothetical protein
MPDYSVRCVEIKRVKDEKTVGATRFGPQSLLAVFGCLESLFLLALGIAYRDGMAIIAVLLLSSLSTLVGIGNKWELRLHKRTADMGKAVPNGDVVIRYPRGNFLIVQCNEEVARELYFAPEAIDYLVRNSHGYRLISLVGTMMIMFGVITLANAQIQLQMAFAASYILLNAAYWIVAALPIKLHWDTSCYEIAKQRFDKSEYIHAKTFTDGNKTFTRALWKAIIATKRIGWVKHSGATPNSKAWDAWLLHALDVAKAAKFHMDGDVKVFEVPDWDAQGFLTNLVADPDYAEVASTMTMEAQVEDVVAGSEKC